MRIGLDLMVQQSLNVVDRQQVLSVHGNDDGVPDLRDQDLGLVLDFHVAGSDNLGVDSLGQSGKDVFPWCPDTHSKRERSSNRKDRVPNDIPQECVEEEEREVHDVHDGQGEGGLVGAEGVSKVSVGTVLDLHADHDSNRVSEREGQEEVGFGEFTSENQDPQQPRCGSVGSRHLGV